MQYHEHILRESVKSLSILLEEYDLDPPTLAYILTFIGERIAKSITPDTLDEAVAGVIADAVENARLLIKNSEKIAAKNW